ncbi:MAG: hypothetical protein MJD61_20295 [Proteobacteria bacterium]|nr:hypothetical protein [Pseudomonadota bacterium]
MPPSNFVEQADVPYQTPKLCAGGQPFFLEVDMKSMGTRTGPGGESLLIRAVIRNNLKKRGSIVSSREILRSDGTPALPADKPWQARRIAAKGQLTRELSTPGGLEDGHYQLRVHVAQRSDDGAESTAMGIQYFKIESGSIIPLDVNEYFREIYAENGRRILQ